MGGRGCPDRQRRRHARARSSCSALIDARRRRRPREPVAVGQALSLRPCRTLAPTPTPAPTLSPLVAKFQALPGQEGLPVPGHRDGVRSSYTSASQSLDVAVTIRSIQGGRRGRHDQADDRNGKTATYDNVNTGSHGYERLNGGPWIDKASRRSTDTRQLADPCSRRLDCSSTPDVETKNGQELHRLEVADLRRLQLRDRDSWRTSTEAHLTLTFWVKADTGAPVAFRVDGTLEISMKGVATRHDPGRGAHRLGKLSGVAIAAPKNPWKWVVDDDLRRLRLRRCRRTGRAAARTGCSASTTYHGRRPATPSVRGRPGGADMTLDAGG